MVIVRKSRYIVLYDGCLARRERWRKQSRRGRIEADALQSVRQIALTPWLAAQSAYRVVSRSSCTTTASFISRHCRHRGTRGRPSTARSLLASRSTLPWITLINAAINRQDLSSFAACCARGESCGCKWGSRCAIRGDSRFAERDSTELYKFARINKRCNRR